MFVHKLGKFALPASGLLSDIPQLVKMTKIFSGLKITPILSIHVNNPEKWDSVLSVYGDRISETPKKIYRVSLTLEEAILLKSTYVSCGYDKDGVLITLEYLEEMDRKEAIKRGYKYAAVSHYTHEVFVPGKGWENKKERSLHFLHTEQDALEYISSGSEKPYTIEQIGDGLFSPAEYAALSLVG